jgi:hypothetical protein
MVLFRTDDRHMTLYDRGKFHRILLLEPVRRPLEKPATTTESESDMQTQENPKFDLKMEKVI